MFELLRRGSVMTRLLLAACLLAAWAAGPARATDVRLQLNWAPGADHAPLYYALEQGWFAERGVTLHITPGGGSAFTLAAVAQGEFDLGIADFFAVMRGKAKGQQVTAVMNLFVNAPHSFYWLKDSGIRGLADFPGKRLGTLREDPARRLWHALAAQAAVDPGSVVWVDMAHNMKVSALAEGHIDVATNPFFHNHASYEAAFGDRLVELPWRTLGFNPYSNSLIAHPAFLARERAATTAVVQVLQRAVSTCLHAPEPCLRALLQANDSLDSDATRRNWRLVESLLRANDNGAVIGAFEAQRLQADYDMLVKYFGVEKPFDPAQLIDTGLINQDHTFQ